MNNPTTKKQISSHAAAAKLIRSELKKHGIKGRVTSSTFAGGNSVSVYLKGAPPWTRKAIGEFADQFQYGRYDGMQDIYEYSNSRDDIPQVKYVSVTNQFTDDMHQKAYEYLLNTMQAYLDFPPAYKDAQNQRGAGAWVSTEVWQVLNGSWDKRSIGAGPRFWEKPRIKMAG